MDPALPADMDDALLVRFLAEEASVQERRQVENWMAADPQHQRYVEQMRLIWQNSATAGDFAAIDAKSDWEEVKVRMDPRWKETRPLSPAKNRWLYPLLRIAAVLVLGLGIVIEFSPGLKQYFFNREQVRVAADKPVQFTLPDGTKVYLNTNARLYYPENFSGAKRAVRLTGEAFFEVTPDREKPFVIATGKVFTRVLGTSFSVNAPVEDSVLVTVVTGKVALEERDKEADQVIMNPGETGAYLKGQLTKAANGDPNFLAWKTGILTFQSTPLPEVARTLSRYYHRPVQLHSPALASCVLSTSFDHQTLEAALAELQLVLPVTLQTRGDTLLLTGEGCR